MDTGLQERKVAHVTGASSGIGFETALILGRTRIHTYATMSNLEKSKTIIDQYRKFAIAGYSTRCEYRYICQICCR